jgi:flagellar biosynthetic protein FliO
MNKWLLKAITFVFFLAGPIQFAYSENTPQTEQAQKNQAKATENWAESEKMQPVPETRFGELFIRMIVLLALTLLFVFAFAFVAKRFLTNRMLDTGRGGRIQILEKRMLSPKACVYLIQVDNKQFVVGESANEIQLLKDLSLPVEKI